MLALCRTPDEVAPFRSVEEAWLWTMAAVVARRDGAGEAWRPDGPSRPCDPDDMLRCLDTLYRQGGIGLPHVRVLRFWGERQRPPRADRPLEMPEWRLWRGALGQLEWALRARGVVH